MPTAIGAADNDAGIEPGVVAPAVNVGRRA